MPAMSSFICDDKTEWKKTIAVKSRRFDSDTWRGAELWDLLDEDGMPIGATHVRGEKLPHGAYHRVVEIFTVNSKGELLVTKRAPEKKLYPEMWETTGGAVFAGEDSLDAARRELRGYFARKDVPVEELTMQPGETVAARWVTLSEFERMIGDGLVPAPVCRRYSMIKYVLVNKL